MKAPVLVVHYHHQVEYLRSMEHQLLEVIAVLKRYVPTSGFTAAVADIENCSRGRLEFLYSMSRGVEPPAEGRKTQRSDLFVNRAMLEIYNSGTARAHALALTLCASLDRQLINGYRVGRQLAEGLAISRDVSRLDAMMGALADRNLCWNTTRCPAELLQTAFVAG